MANEVATPADVNPIGHMLDDYQEYVREAGGTIEIDYDEDDDSFDVVRGDGPGVVIYSSEIDGDFYHEGTAVFVEAEVGASAGVDLADVMRFSGDELVLSRISLSERGDDNYVIVVEAALPISLVDFPLFDLIVREVATIASDIRRQLNIAAPVEMEEVDDEDEEES